MRVDRVGVETLAIPFRAPFSSGALRWEHRRVAIVSLQADTGVVGRGEFVAPEPAGLGQSVSGELVDELEGIDLADPLGLARSLHAIERWPFVGRVARAAVESALVDLLARGRGVPVARWLAPDAAAEVVLNALIGIVSPESAATEAERLVGAGYGCLKLKAGDEPPGVLEARVSAVRAAAGPHVALRLDFNGGLDQEGAATLLERLAEHGLEYVEQPLAPAAGSAALARLRGSTAVPIAADESLRDVRSADELIEAGAVDVLVVKPARVGGLRQARSIIERATAAGVAVTVSTFFETGVGIAGALQLAATVPGDRAHGLATAGLLESDLLTASLPIERGRMALPAGPGLGIDLDAAAVARFRVA